MPRRVLISFLGTGPLASKETRTYKTASYRMGDEALGDYPFVSAALKNYYHIDKIVLVGTVHSMWEEVYRWFSLDSGRSVNDDIYFSIADACEKYNYKSALTIPHQAEIEQAIGNDSKVILIKYGISEDEVMENINIILGLEQYLHKNDELIVDVTHSFRSLPIFMMNLLVYLKNVSEKNINISHIHYGMLEVDKELGFTPIIDLKAMLEVNDWITGAYSFSQFGNAYRISELIKGEDKSVATLLEEYSNLMNLNHLHAIQNISQRLSAIKNKKYTTLLPQLTINPVINSFISRFSVPQGKHSLFQLKVAKWQLEHKKYAQSMLTINEAMITYICEKNGMEWNDYNMREMAKAALKYRQEAKMIRCDREFKQIYKKLKPLRNCTAHSIESEKSVPDMLRVLANSISVIETIIK